MLEHSETLQLLQSAQGGDEEAKTTLMVHNAPLVKSVIRRYRNKGVEYDDLYQLGCMGLLKAIMHFDTKFEVQFSTYAVPMIAGEVKRFLRDDGSIKVSRQLKSTASKIRQYIDEETKRTGESPRVEAVAAAFGMDEQELVFVMDSNKMPISIYERSDEQDERSQSLLDKLNDEDRTDEMIDRLVLRDFIRQLPEKERQLVLLRFFRDKTQSEIARVIGVSQVQVSRMESRILNKMRECFQMGM